MYEIVLTRSRHSKLGGMIVELYVTRHTLHEAAEG
jgi:hypothetical protein